MSLFIYIDLKHLFTYRKRGSIVPPIALFLAKACNHRRTVREPNLIVHKASRCREIWYLVYQRMELRFCTTFEGYRLLSRTANGNSVPTRLWHDRDYMRDLFDTANQHKERNSGSSGTEHEGQVCRRWTFRQRAKYHERIFGQSEGKCWDVHGRRLDEDWGHMPDRWRRWHVYSWSYQRGNFITVHRNTEVE